jgi:hypothetical protein
LGPAVHRAGTLSLTVIATVVIASCGGGSRSLSDLKSLPESGLHPPDARFVSHNEHDAEQTIDGPLAAIVGDVFATEDDADGIIAFYDAELTRRGYVRDDRDPWNVRTTIEVTVRVWRHDDVAARVAIYRADDPQVPPLPSDMPNGTLFELALANAHAVSPGASD